MKSSKQYEEFVVLFSKDTIFYKDNEQFHFDESTGFLAQQGYCWGRKAGSKAKAIASKNLKVIIHQHSMNARSVQKDLLGEYSMIYRSATAEVIAFNDDFGIESIFYYQDDNICVISNREDFVRVAASIDEYNVSTLCQLPLVGYRLLDEGISKSIKKLPPGGVLSFTHKSGVCIDSTHPVFLQKEPMSFSEKNKKLEELIDAGIEEVKSNLYAVMNVVDRIPLGLTGGKDSRLTLAFCHAFGVSGKIDAFTNGHPNHPDVQVAQLIAKKYNLNHIINSPQHSSTSIPYISAKELFHRIAVHVFRTDSVFGAWDLKSRGGSGYGLQLSGFLGEIFKSYLKTPMQISKESLPSDIIKKHGIYDPLGLIDPSIKNNIDVALKEKLWAYLGLGYDLSDLSDLYYATIRVPQWLGAARLVDGYNIQSVSIINSPSLSQLALNLPAHERSLHIIHYELMKRLSPKLLEVPLALQAWSPELEKYGASQSIFHPPVAPLGNIPSGGSWQFLINDNPYFRKLLINLVEKTTPLKLWGVINKKKLLKQLQTKKFSHYELISLYGIITVMFKEAHLSFPDRLEHHEKTDFFSNSTLLKTMHTNQNLVFNNNELKTASFDDKELDMAIKVDEKCLDIIFEGEIEKFSDQYPQKKNILKKIMSLRDKKITITFRGFVEKFDEQSISGWVYCKEFPHARLILDIFINDKLAYQISADKLRQDLKNSDIGEGDHAFNFRFKKHLGINSDILTIKVSGSNYTLPWI